MDAAGYSHWSDMCLNTVTPIISKPSTIYTVAIWKFYHLYFFISFLYNRERKLHAYSIRLKILWEQVSDFIQYFLSNILNMLWAINKYLLSTVIIELPLSLFFYLKPKSQLFQIYFFMIC